MVTYLDRILESHRAAKRSDSRRVADLADLADQAAGAAPRRGFRDALDAHDGLSLIAEVKRRSPSRGDLAPDLDPAVLAEAYEAGGASCVSVLTDVDFFGGSPADLRAARAACSLPVLRKDFTVDERDIYDACLMGADAVLLIAAALDDVELASFSALARELGLDVLVEVHDEPELERALTAGADLVGVNQRDLVTFEVDTDRAVRLAAQLPPDVVRVAESGIHGPADASRLATAGYHAALVGEWLVTSSDPARAVASLVGRDDPGHP